MSFKPMTYLVSFTMFVLLFMALGGYVGYGKIADHFLAQAFLDATPINVHTTADQQGPALRWDDKVPLSERVSVSISASNRPVPISLHYSDEPLPRIEAIHSAPKSRTEDIRIDKERRFLYTRVFAASEIKSKETTWLYKYDLQTRKLVRRTSVNPIMLPPPFKP